MSVAASWGHHEENLRNSTHHISRTRLGLEAGYGLGPIWVQASLGPGRIRAESGQGYLYSLARGVGGQVGGERQRGVGFLNGCPRGGTAASIQTDGQPKSSFLIIL